MNSRERILKCIRHEPIDRVPISTYELVGWNENSWENKQPSYKRLMDYIREYTDCIYMLDPKRIEKDTSTIVTNEWKVGNSKYIKKIYAVPGKPLETLERIDDNINTIWKIKHLANDLDDLESFFKIPYSPPLINSRFL